MGKGGIVRDPELHQAACDRVRAAVEMLGFPRARSSKVRFSAPKAIGSFCSMPKPLRSNTAAIISKPRSDERRAVVPQLIDWLKQRGVATRLDPETAAYCGRGAANASNGDEVAEGAQLLIVLGGDGTLLSAARAVGRPQHSYVRGQPGQPGIPHRHHSGRAVSATGARARAAISASAPPHAATRTVARRANAWLPTKRSTICRSPRPKSRA